MRRILVSRARAAQASKRCQGVEDLPLDDFAIAGPEVSVDVIALDAALTLLGQIDPQ